MTKILLSRGNKKIGSDTFIINMTSATECPSKERRLCRISDKCYAMKAERMYPECLPYRRRQREYWNNNSAENIYKDLRERISSLKKPIKYIRFSEAGDFESQWDVNKLSKIAEHLHFVVFYGYTARADLDFSRIPNNLIINGSSFMLNNQFKAVPKDYVRQKGERECKGNCRTCHLCKSSAGRNIIVRYH